MPSPLTYPGFLASIEQDAPPPELSAALQALWWDRKGDWARGHSLLRDEGPISDCRVHAYLHRREGEDWNARYWYSRAEEPFYEGELDDEWSELVKRYLKE